MSNPFRFADCLHAAESAINKIKLWLNNNEIKQTSISWYERKREITIPQLQVTCTIESNPEDDKPHITVTVQSGKAESNLGQFSSGSKAGKAVIGWIKNHDHEEHFQPTE